MKPLHHRFFLFIFPLLVTAQTPRRILHQPLFPVASSPPPPPDASGQDQPFFPEDPTQQSQTPRRILHQPLFPVTSSPPPLPPPPPDASGQDQPFFPEDPTQQSQTPRRILHQPLFPVTSSPPPLPPPPPPDASGQDQPFFPEDPTQQSQTPATPPPPPSTGSQAIPAATQPTSPTKKVAIAISVVIVTLGMLSALSFYIYKHKSKRPKEDHKLEAVSSRSQSYADGSRPPPSSFLYIGTVDPSNEIPLPANENAGESPRRKFSAAKKSDRYRPSPDLQPLSPLGRPPPTERPSPPRNSRAAVALSSSSDEGSRENAFYTPQASVASFDESFSTPVSKHGSFRSNGSSKRNSLSRIPASSPELIKHAIIPSIKTAPPPYPPPPPPEEAPRMQPLPPEKRTERSFPSRARFGAPPPPPNLSLLQSTSSQPHRTLPPPPPPPPPPPVSSPPRVRSTWTNFIKKPSESSASEPQFLTPNSKQEEDDDHGCSSSTKPRLRPLHWDKVRATSDRATVWDQMTSSSFQVNEDEMQNLFGCNSNNPKNPTADETTQRSARPPEKEKRILDPKKSQNIAILLRALHVTREEVSEALLEGNSESLGAELLETLVKMAPTKEEEIKLTSYKGDTSKLGSAEKFLMAVLDIPFAFKRVEAMLYRANFDSEVKYLRQSFQTLEEASIELKSSKLFLKLLEAVLTAGNRMNVGTNRGGASSFKLDTLLKLADIKGTDGKTTLLHFVVQEIIKSEGINPPNPTGKEEDFRKQGLLIVSGLSREIGRVKLAAGMDSDVLHSYVSKLETGLQKIKTIEQYEKSGMQGGFFISMKEFLTKAEEEICVIKEMEGKALRLVKEVTDYFHGDAAKEEAHPFRIFVIVRDFLSTLDHVCKDVGILQERAVMGAARSFRVSNNVPLPVLSRYNVRRDDSSSEESSSP